MHEMGLVGDMYAGLGQRGIVITIERRKMLGVTLRSAVRSEEPVLKIDRHFRHDGIAFFILRRSYLDRRQQVLLRIAPQYTYRQLRACKHNRFTQVLQHERQRRSRVTHRVRTMQDYEAVVLLVMVIHHLRHAHPTSRIDIRRVDQRRESLYIHLYLTGKQLRHKGLERLHIRRHQGPRRGIPHHGDRSACRNQKYLTHCSL